MSPDQIAEKARSVAAQMPLGDGRSALEGFAEWIDEQERKRIEARDNTTMFKGGSLEITLTRDKAYDVTITVHRYGGGTRQQRLRGWLYEGTTGYSQSYLRFGKPSDPERPYLRTHREISRDDILSVVPA